MVTPPCLSRAATALSSGRQYNSATVSATWPTPNFASVLLGLISHKTTVPLLHPDMSLLLWLENKRDVIEFDSSNGKIISISFDTKNLSKKQIYLFYINFFEENKWKKNENENVWETKNKTFKKKIFKIENFEDNILNFKIIVENF